MKVTPEISYDEKCLVREVMLGSSPGEAWTASFGQKLKPADLEKLTAAQRKERGKNIMKRKRVQAWTAYFENASAEEMIENTYLTNVAFGNSKEAMGAADAFLKSQFAGKEVAEIFIETLRNIQAEIVIPCNGKVERVSL